MSKQKNYKALVQKRKACRICEDYGLKNQAVIANGRFDEEIAIGAWSLWQGSLNAKIMLVGQDWGDQASFEKDQGASGIDDNVTDINLITLFKTLGIDLAHPTEGNRNPFLFFTNIVLCMKKGGLAAKIPGKCYSNCAHLFLKDLIKIIQPKIIITLGKNAYQYTVKLYDQKPEPYKMLLDRIKQNSKPLLMRPHDRLPEVVLLPAPHCGQYSSNTFMGLADQKKLWSSLKGLIP